MTDPGDDHAVLRARATGRIYPAGWHAVIRSVSLVTNAEVRAVYGEDDPWEDVRLIERDRVVYDDTDTVRAVSVSWFDVALLSACPRLLQPERIPQGTFRYIEECTGLVVARAEDVITARPAAVHRTDDTWLSSVVLCTTTTWSTTDGVVIEYGRSVTPAHEPRRYWYDVPPPDETRA